MIIVLINNKYNLSFNLWLKQISQDIFSNPSFTLKDQNIQYLGVYRFIISFSTPK